jgi:uncharacterized protein (TIGR03435 family)
MMLISSAYEIREYQVINAPGWTSTEHYDVQAIGDVSALDDVRARRDALNEMARNLLTDRFHLAAHREKRPIEVYALTLAGRDGKLGPSLTVSQVDCDSRPIGRDRPPAQLTIDDFNKPPACGIRGSATSWFAGGEKIDSLVTELSNDLHAPVTDHTNLTRRYTISLRWSVDAASATSDTPPLPVALEQQLGLRLERRKEPLDVLVIDQIERPTTD